MIQLIRSIKRKQIIGIVIVYMVASYVWLVLKTTRKTYHIPDATMQYLQSNQPAIFALWHSRIMLVPAFKHGDIGICAIVSNHADGRLIGKILKLFGFGVVYGSTSTKHKSKGGAQAMRQLIRIYKGGRHIAITPDGPRGPNQVAGAGVAQLAMLTNAPVICVSCAASWCFRLKSWDRFMLALPFSKVHFIYGTPIIADAEGREELRHKIETDLNHLTQEAEAKIS